MNKSQRTSIIWSWVALLVVSINIFFNYYLNANPIAGQTIGDVSDKYPTLITPAGYAFSIWGLIYLAFIIYAIYQVLPSQHKNQVYSRLSQPLIVTSLLSIGWLISFSLEYILWSVLIIAGMLVTAIWLFGESKKATYQQRAPFWITIPFSLYMAWLSVATIVNTAVWLTDLGWQGGTIGETTWSIFVLGVVLVLGIIISYKFKEIPYPMVIVWAMFAIYAARKNENETIAITALLIGVVLALWTIGFGLWLYKSLQPKMSGNPN